MNYRIKCIFASLAIIALSGQLLAVNDKKNNLKNTESIAESAKPETTAMPVTMFFAEQRFKKHEPCNIVDVAEWACNEIETYPDWDNKILRALVIFEDVYSTQTDTSKNVNPLLFLLNHAYKNEYEQAKNSLFFNVDSYKVYKAAFELGGEYKKLATRVCDDEYDVAISNIEKKHANNSAMKNNVLLRCNCLKKALEKNLPAAQFDRFWKKANPEYLNQLLSKQRDYALIEHVQAYKFPVKQSNNTDTITKPLQEN